MKVIVINGSAGVGKDTFVNLCLSLYPFGTVRCYSSVDEIKRFATFMGWEGTKTEKDRKFLSELKRICTEWHDIPMQSMRKAVKRYSNSFYDCKYLFLMVREPDEIQKVKEEFDAVTLLLVRDSVPAITSNYSDAGVFDYPYDYVIDNYGTLDDLRFSAEVFLKEVGE